jgi:hypothetical protein
MTDLPTEDLELFISHASEDKADLVRRLADRLRHWGIKVWYDEYSLSPGDSLSRSLDKGLSRTRYGLVVISRSFIKKPWTEYELRGLTAKEMFRRDKVIIPIWHDVTEADVVAFSPPLADKVAVRTDGKSVDEVAEAIIKAIRPGVAQQMSVFRALRQLSNAGEPVKIPLEQLAPMPEPRSFTSDGNIIMRSMLVTEILAEPRGLAGGFSDFLVNLYRDLHPEQELQLWELFATIFVQVDRRHDLSPEQRTHVLRLLLACSLADDDIESVARDLPEQIAADALLLWQHYFDISRLEAVTCVRDEDGNVRILRAEKRAEDGHERDRAPRSPDRI